jgi:uncharacterized protein DUF3800
MAVRICYIDESYDDDVFCLTAISIRHTDWNECFDLVREHRKSLKEKYGIPMHKEIHARDFVRGRGQVSKMTVGKWDRSRVFLGILHLVASLPTVRIFNVCLQRKGLADAQMCAWDRLMNRIERTMKAFEQIELPTRKKAVDSIRAAVQQYGPFLSVNELDRLELRLLLFRSRAIIISVEGRELEITSAVRKMRVHNPIPSRYGRWKGGRAAKNIRTERIIEDPIFKPSSRSYFLQLADCVAFALLKQEVPATPNVKKYGLNEMFPVLKPVCYLKASPKDPFGIVRK